MVSFVYLRKEASRSLNELLGPDYYIEEAFSVSEAVWLCTQHHIGIIVVAHNFEDFESLELRQRFLVVDMKPDTTTRELLWLLAPPEASAAAC